MISVLGSPEEQSNPLILNCNSNSCSLCTLTANTGQLLRQVYTTHTLIFNPNSLDNKGSCWILKDLYCSVTMLRELGYSS